MPLPQNFQFNQSNLHDFTECRRRFYLRYLRQVAWPAAEAEPVQENERWMQQGVAFHRMIHQFFLGIPAERLSELPISEELTTWWHNFLDHYPSFIGVSDPGTRFSPEFTLSMPFAGSRLVAKYDLLVILPDGRVVIYDWKTSRQVTRRNFLQKHLQTCTYPFLLAEAGQNLLHGTQIEPDKINMIYWFTGFPLQPEVFSYSPKLYRDDKDFLTSLVQQITRLSIDADQDGFPLTPEVKFCRFCVYRSLCNRGIKAGDLDEMEILTESSLEPINLDFDQVQEIEF